MGAVGVSSLGASASVSWVGMSGLDEPLGFVWSHPLTGHVGEGWPCSGSHVRPQTCPSRVLSLLTSAVLE